jgi:diguanylate cyclase (GGDEF)-like protein/PAS domain S-box-containing protein/putative nucleotidyltransferase with HDIG domain
MKEQLKILEHKSLLLEVMNREFKNRQEHLDYALNELLQMNGSQYGYIYFYDEDREEFIINSWTKGVMKECDVKEYPAVYNLEKTGIWGEVVRQRKAIIVNDFAKKSPYKKGYPKGHVELKRFMSIPLFIDGKIVAVAGFGNKAKDYGKEDVYDMSMLLNGVWTAVQRRETEERLNYERNKYYQTLKSMGDGVIIVDRNKKIEFINDAAARLIGWDSFFATGRKYDEVVVLSFDDAQNDPVDTTLVTGEASKILNYAKMVSKDNEYYYVSGVSSPIYSGAESKLSVVFVFRDITERIEQRKKIEYISFHDYLTGIYNRRFFEEELARLDVKRNLPISIMLGDINGLKLTNDVFGHKHGDLLIKKVAEILKDTMRSDDIIARWGGDEFVMLLPNTDSKSAADIAKRVEAKMNNSSISPLGCSISLAFDVKTEISMDVQRVLANAEAKMYLKKTVENSNISIKKLNAIEDLLFKSNGKEKNHVDNVIRICKRLGQALKLSDTDMEKLIDAAYYHDIGKVISDTSIESSGINLYTSEEERVVQHPAVGYRILRYFDKTNRIAEIVLAHHEKWDGTGYPKGIKGEEIPFLSRIIAVAANYDRIMTFSKGGEKTKGDAMLKIQMESGTSFDPAVVEAFVSMHII